MNPSQPFPPAVQAALSYPAPGVWMPALPPGRLRLSAGYPFTESVPAAELARATAELVAAEGDRPFHYLGSSAAAALPELISERLKERGVGGALLVTAGAAQALDLAARALLGPDDLVAVEAPTYMEALEIFRNYTPHIAGYPLDADGLQTEALAADLAVRRAAGKPLPKLFYTVASFQNPAGATLSPERRRHLLNLAAEYGFWVLEDDAYGELAFRQAPVPLRALPGGERVIHVGSLSKVVAPGLRVGWVAAEGPILQAMALFKKDLDHPFSQAVAATYLRSIDLGARLSWLRGQYSARRDHLLTALAREMPPGVTWSQPEGGFFVWVQAPGVDTAALLPRALEAGVAYVPGCHFYFGAGESDRLRLSFSYLPLADLDEGIRRLGEVLAAVVQ